MSYKRLGKNWDLLERICDLEIDIEVLLSRPDLISLMMPLAEEWDRRMDHEGWKYVPDDSPKRNQVGFHSSEAMIRMACGGNQSGKSRAAAQEVKWWAEGTHPYLKTPMPAKIYVVSANYQNHLEGVYRHLLGGDAPILSYWEVEKLGPQVADVDMPRWIRMKNGSEITFLSAEGGDKARKRFQAAAVDLCLIDEEIDESSWTELKMRLLARGGRVAISATLVESYDWLCKLEDRAESGSDEVQLWRFDTERALECGHVQKKQFAQVFADMSDDEKHVRLHGGSRKRQGLIYQEFASQFHICQPFEIPADWTRYCGVDPGWNTCAVIWLAVNPEGRVYFYRQLYTHNKNHRQIAAMIHDAEGYEFVGTKEVPLEGTLGVLYEKDLWRKVDATEHIEMRVIDPSAFGTSTEGTMKIGSLFASRYDLGCAPAINDVNTGIEAVKQGLTVNESLDPPQAKFQFFADLTDVFSEFRGYRWPKERASMVDNRRLDKPVKKKDHAMDTIRYLAILNPHYVDPEMREEEDPEEFHYDHLVSKDVNEVRRREFAMQKRDREGDWHQEEHAGGIGTIY